MPACRTPVHPQGVHCIDGRTSTISSQFFFEKTYLCKRHGQQLASIRLYLCQTYLMPRALGISCFISLHSTVQIQCKDTASLKSVACPRGAWSRSERIKLQNVYWLKAAVEQCTVTPKKRQLRNVKKRLSDHNVCVVEVEISHFFVLLTILQLSHFHYIMRIKNA